MIAVKPGIHVRRFSDSAAATGAVFEYANSGRPLSSQCAFVMAEPDGVILVIGERTRLAKEVPFVASRIKKRLRQRDRGLLTFLFEASGSEVVQHVVCVGDQPRETRIGG